MYNTALEISSVWAQTSCFKEVVLMGSAHWPPRSDFRMYKLLESESTSPTSGVSTD
jgi:hypothetical protein